MSAALRRSEELLELARSRAAQDRERLLLAVVDLCEASADAATPEVGRLLGDVFLTLVGQAERDIRRNLSERLAYADWAPRALINVLALDEIEIARPVIAASPVLRDNDLTRLLVEATIEHQIEVARRPGIGPRIVDAVIDRGEPAVLTALAGNETAEIGEANMRRLVDASRRITGLRAPLVRHPRLTKGLAEQLYGWVGQALRTAIVERFRVDAEALDRLIAEAVRDAQGGPTPTGAPARDPQREEMERRLIAKLDAADQLRPGFLVRALRENKLSLFEAALAALGGFAAEDVRAAVEAAEPRRLALACAAVGLDRVVFAEAAAVVSRLNGGRPAADREALRACASVFELDPAQAAAAFRARDAA